MNTQELHIGVNLGLQKVASNVFDDFLSQEIDYYLNEAVRDFIKEQFSFIKNEGRDVQSQYVNENLRTLIKTEQVGGASMISYLPNSVKYDLPNEYLYYVFSRTNADGDWKNNRLLEPKGVKDYIETQYNSPQFREFPILLEHDNIIVIGDSVTTLNTDTQVHLTYIEKPNKINFEQSPSVELVLPEHTHQDIVNIAVDKLLTIIQGRRE